MPISLSIPGSKSITNRALLLAALSEGKTVIKNSGFCDDTNYMIKGLKKLGIKLQQKGKNITVTGNGGKFKKQKKTVKIYTGNAGTTTRFLTALATLTENKIVIDGDKRMRERPISELVNALNQLGAKIKSKNGYLPLQIDPKKIIGGKISLNGNISSQYLSAILMIAPLAKEKITVKIEQKLCSRPYVNITLEAMKRFGIKSLNKNFNQFEIKPQKYKAQKTFTVDSDASATSYPAAYIALHPEKKLNLKNLNLKSLQGDIKFIEYLKKMGCKVSEIEKSTTIKGPEKLKSLETIDMNETPDLVMTFAILSLFADKKTRITNIGNLRIKETDRINALQKELKKLGAKVKTGKDWIEIFPLKTQKNRNNNISIKTYNDHRIAMAFAILKDTFPNLTIENPKCVSKSYPTFWQDLKKLSKS